MASLEERKSKDGKITYRVKIRLKGYPTQTATFERKTDAKKWVQQTESAIREGRHFRTVEAKRHTLSQLIDKYIADVLPRLKSAKQRIRHLEWWKKEIGEYTLADVKPPLIVECRNKLASGQTVRKQPRSKSTVNRYLASLSHVFTMAVKEWHWTEDNPLQKVSNYKEPRGRVRFLSDEERKALLEACKSNDVLYAIVVLALSTGARKGEILNLRWRDIDLNREIIVLEETKNGERRVLPLTGHAKKLIQELGKVRSIKSDLVFPSKRAPKRPLTIQKVFDKAMADAGINDFRFHDLRHSAASYLAMNGASLAEIAEILGHKTLQMVKRYAHLSEAHTASVVASMNERIFGSE